MANIFLCPTCGAPLDPNGDSETVRCQHCNNSVVVPPEWRQSASQMSAVLSRVFNLGKVQQFQEVTRLAHSGQTEEAAALFR